MLGNKTCLHGVGRTGESFFLVFLEAKRNYHERRGP